MVSNGVQAGLYQIEVLGTEAVSCGKEGTDSPCKSQLVYKVSATCCVNKWSCKKKKKDKMFLRRLPSPGVSRAVGGTAHWWNTGGEFLTLGHIRGIPPMCCISHAGRAPAPRVHWGFPIKLGHLGKSESAGGRKSRAGCPSLKETGKLGGFFQEMHPISKDFPLHSDRPPGKQQTSCPVMPAQRLA